MKRSKERQSVEIDNNDPSNPSRIFSLDLCRRLMSQEKEEYSSILKSHFTPDCVIDNDDLYAKGVRNIEKLLDFTTSICKSSGLVGEPKWNENKQTITFTYYRHLKLGFKITQITVLHLRQDGKEGDWKVIKIGDKHINLQWTSIPVIGPM